MKRRFSGRQTSGRRDNWYSAKILYESVTAPDDADVLCEENIRVFRASDERSAALKAEQAGRAGEHSYENEAGARASWTFQRVIEIQDLCESSIEDGTGVFSQMVRKG